MKKIHKVMQLADGLAVDMIFQRTVTVALSDYKRLPPSWRVWERDVSGVATRMPYEDFQEGLKELGVPAEEIARLAKEVRETK